MLKDQIISLRLQGKSVKTIAKLLGCSRSTSSKWCATVENNQDIIGSNTRVGYESLFKKRELEILRQKKPNEPSWFNSYKSRLRDAVRAYLVYLSGGKCQVCGYDKCKEALSFHHLDPSVKRFRLSGMFLTYSLQKVLEEHRKCCLVCHNCHTEIHNGLVSCPAVNIKQEDPPESVVLWYYS